MQIFTITLILGHWMYLMEKEILQRTNKTNIKGSLIERPEYPFKIHTDTENYVGCKRQNDGWPLLPFSCKGNTEL